MTAEGLLYRAGWVVSIARPPVASGWVHVREGLVVRAGGPDDRPPTASPGLREIDLGDAAILPGLVNAHTHLELSWLKGRIAPRPSLPEWIGALLALRPDPALTDAEGEASAIRDAVRELSETGTSLVGDISNTTASADALAAAGMYGVVFHELIGFRREHCAHVIEQADRTLASSAPSPRVRRALAAHAPYSVSPDMFRAIAARWAARGGPCSVHLAESREELQFLAAGQGAWRDLLERLNAWDPTWTPPRCGPVEYLARCGLPAAGLLVVHGVQLADDELQTLARAQATLVTCPRSNQWTGAGTAPVRRFYESGVAVAVGTDSLASNDDLNLFSELAAMRALAPNVPASTLLASATRVGARALGFGDELGTIEPGRRAALIAVQVPRGERDVEEYLVRGIEPGQIRNLD